MIQSGFGAAPPLLEVAPVRYYCAAHNLGEPWIWFIPGLWAVFCAAIYISIYLAVGLIRRLWKQRQ